MPSQLTSEMSSSATTTNKRSSDGEPSTPISHEYTICLVGDWTHLKPTKMKPLTSLPDDRPLGPSAVYEVAADLESPIVHVSCGSDWGCLLCEDGRAYSFGDNTYGQLGQGHNQAYVTVPVAISTPFCQPRRRILRLSCGTSHGGFVLDIGELYMFGCGSYGRLGTGSEDNTCVPIMVQMKWSKLLTTTTGSTSHRKPQNNSITEEDEDFVRFTDLSCGDRHTLALTIRRMKGNSDGRHTTTKTGIVAFGDGMNGRLGLGDDKDRHEGALLTTWLAASNIAGIGIAGHNGCMTPPTITAISAGSTHNLALSTTGHVFSWGNGVDGQLGHGTAVSEWVPRQVAFFKNLSIGAVSCGASHSMAVSQTGVVYTWGRGTEGQLGLDLECDSTVDVVHKSVKVPRPVEILKNSTHRVTIRTIVAKQNISLAFDDRDRMFVWGDNALEQLGIPLAANTEIGTKSFLPKPKLLAYMDLHAPKSATCNAPLSISRVSSLRELVAAAKPEPIRLGLAHVDAGDRFTMLVFRTKPGMSTCSNTGGDTQQSKSQMPLDVTEEPKATIRGGNWNFSLTKDLSMSAIPSRESAYYQFMTNYKVYMRPTIPNESNDGVDRDRDIQRRSPRRRMGSTISKRGSFVDTATLEKWELHATNGDCRNHDSVCSSSTHVMGFDSWLDKRLSSPSKTGYSFANTPRFPSPLSKNEETRTASTTKMNATPQTKGAPSLPMKPQKPKSAFGQTFSIRRITMF